MNDGLIVAIAFAAAICICGVAYTSGSASVVNDCRTYGKSKVGGVILICQEQK